MRYKRPYDIFLITVFLPVWIPICVIIGLLVLLTSGFPIFYTQERLGRGGRVFRIIKFRTMIRDAEWETGPVWAKVEDSRVTPLGRMLRHLGLDELPQIINVIRGEMSLVGPRPERPELAEQFEKKLPNFALRLAVLPGIASLLHLHGNYHTPPRHRLRYDLIYIRRMSLIFDTYILFMVCVLVARRFFGR